MAKRQDENTTLTSVENKPHSEDTFRLFKKHQPLSPSTDETASYSDLREQYRLLKDSLEGIEVDIEACEADLVRLHKDRIMKQGQLLQLAEKLISHEKSIQPEEFNEETNGIAYFTDDGILPSEKFITWCNTVILNKSQANSGPPL